jgi:hypothetical protein
MDQLPMAFDSNGKAIGRVAYAPGYMASIVVFRINQAMVPVFISKSGFDGTSYLAFTTDNCTGTPYFATSAGPPSDLFSRSGIRGTSLYLPDYSAPTLTVTEQSFSPSIGTCYKETGTLTVRPSIEVSHFTDQFTPPFSFR